MTQHITKELRSMLSSHSSQVISILFGAMSLVFSGASVPASPVVNISSHDAKATATKAKLVDVDESVRGHVNPASAIPGLRILVRPVKGGPSKCYTSDKWYPQTDLETDKATGDWSIDVTLGTQAAKDHGCFYELLAATFDAAGLKAIDAYLKRGEEKNIWKPIPLPEPTSNRALLRLQRKP
jgi:hypothetical protein